MSSSARKPTDSELAAKILEICNEFDANYYKDAYCFNENAFKSIFNSRCNLSDIKKTFQRIFKIAHEDIINKCIIYYLDISESYKSININLLMELVKLINNYLFYIYQYYTIIKDYSNFCRIIQPSSSISLHKKPKSLIDIDIPDITLFYTKIHENKREYIHNIDNYNSYIQYIIFRFNYSLYKFDIRSTNPKILLSLNTYKSNKLAISKLPDNGYELPSNLLDIIGNEQTLINYILIFKYKINQLNDLSIKYGSKYISIPQYNNICWFISMITGISYSDRNRELIKRNRNDDNIFQKLIFYIIDNITDSKREYTYTEDNKIDKSICKLLKYLKEEPVKTLNNILTHYYINNPNVKEELKKYLINSLLTIQKKIIIDSGEDENTVYAIITLDDIRIACGYNIFDPIIQLIFNNLFIKNDTLEIYVHYTNDDLTGIVEDILTQYESRIYDNTIEYYNYSNYIYHNYILKILYDFLKIKNLYIRNIDGEYYKLKDDIETFHENPEIIIIQKYIMDESIDTHRDKYELLTISNTDLTNKSNVIFNGNKYELDYMLHSSDSRFKCESCGHCISAIHYDNEQYIHDSKNNIDTLKCSSGSISNNYSIPCSLVKYNWVDKLFTNLCYNVNSCGFLNTSTESHVSQKLSFNEKLCYNYDSDYMLVYVKIDEGIAGGNNNKYVSIHKKINFIYKNKKYTRNIYIKNNKKYILFNKKYILLSKIKLASNSH